VSSNPTNLVVAGGFSISFLAFSANLVLPVVASAIAVYPVLRWGLFRSTTLIPPTIPPHGLDPKAALVDSHGAIFGSALMLTTLAVLVGTSAGGLHVEVWMITVPAAIIMFIRDVLHDVVGHRRRSEGKTKSSPGSPTEDHHSGAPVAAEVGETPHESDAIALSTFPSRSTPPRKTSNSSVLSSATKIEMSGHTASPFNLLHRFPTPMTTLRRLPYPLLPFAFSMFILVQGLASTGWIAVFAGWWAAWARVSGLLGVVGGMGFISVCLCNVGHGFLFSACQG
jgi:Na+/H+ antiporter NhaD/arsenite permease-like protein